jgi:ribonucleoside-diphosphate reductase alpha chain
MKPRHSAEQSTVAVNKSISLGKTGFASAFSKVTIPSAQPKIAVEPINSETKNPTEKIIDGKVYKVHGPSDPQEQYTCDSCQ